VRARSIQHADPRLRILAHEIEIAEAFRSCDEKATSRHFRASQGKRSLRFTRYRCHQAVTKRRPLEPITQCRDQRLRSKIQPYL